MEFNLDDAEEIAKADFGDPDEWPTPKLVGVSVPSYETDEDESGRLSVKLKTAE